VADVTNKSTVNLHASTSAVATVMIVFCGVNIVKYSDGSFRWSTRCLNINGTCTLRTCGQTTWHMCAYVHKHILV